MDDADTNPTIKKEEIRSHLTECLRVEELAIPIYARHLGQTLFLSNFSPEDQKRLTNILTRLVSDSQRHKKIFEKMIADFASIA